MAKAFLEVTKPFTRVLGGATVVGHPKHPDPRGKYVSADDGAQIDALVTGGFAKRISEKVYLSKLEGTEMPTAGEHRLATSEGTYPKVSAVWSTQRIQEEAERRGVSLASAGTDRAKMIALLNSKAEDGDGTAADGSIELRDEVAGQLGTLTSDTTGHPPRIGPQNDVTDAGGVDKLFAGTGAAVATGLEAADSAPTGGDGTASQGGSGTAGA